MPRIFISYSRVDSDFAKQLVELLHRNPRYEVWYDDSLHGGDVWWEAILDQIAECDIFIYLLSNDSVISPYCQAEFTEARRLNKMIVTVQVRERTRRSGDLEDIQYVDMTAGVNDGRALAQLFGSIEYQAEQLPKRRPKPLWEERTSRPIMLEDKDVLGSRPDVETPLLNVRAPRKSRAKGWRAWSMPLIIAIAIIIGIIGIEQILTRFATNRNSPEQPSSTSTQISVANVPTQMEIQIPSATLQPTATFTNILISSATPNDRLELVATSISALPNTPNPLGFSGNPVTSNLQWSPITKTFDDNVEMVLVPVGCFYMGVAGEGGRQCFEYPFWIDRYEITNADYGPAGYFGGANKPRDTITWFQAKAYCEAGGGRLPTEAEWEYAARGPDGLLYPWGRDFNGSKVVYNNDSTEETANVGSRPSGVSWVGANDMAGNVWEWVSSLYMPYPYMNGDGRENLVRTDVKRVMRGGSWRNIAIDLRVTVRNDELPGFGGYNVGVRCARNYSAGE